MFERVILHATEGELKGQDFVLENETSCILSRTAKIIAQSVVEPEITRVDARCVQGFQIG